MGSKSGGVTGYKYSFGIHMGLCRGPVDALVTIKVGDKVAWPLEITTQIGGGTVYTGSGDSLESTWTAPVYEITPAQEPVKTSTLIQIKAADLFGGNAKEGGIQGPAYIMMGEATQTAPAALVSMLGGLVSGFRGMFTIFYDGLVCSNNPYPKIWKMRVRRALKGWDGDVFLPEKAVVYLSATFPDVDNGPSVTHPIHAMNGAHILYQCITDKDWGRGLNRNLINIESFTYAANQLCCEGFGLCLKWSKEDDITAFMQKVVDHLGAVLYASREDGKVTLKLIRDDYVVADIPEFTLTNGLISVEEDDASSTQELVNEIVVSYTDPVTDNTKQTRVHNVGSMQASGAIFSKSVDYPGLPTHELATRVAQRDLRATGTPTRRLKLTFDRRGYQIAPGAVFKIAVATRGIGSMVLRAGRVEDGPGGSSTIIITAVEDIFGLPSTSYVEQVPASAPASRKPLPAVYSRIVEAGYIDLVRGMTAAQFALLTTDQTYVFLVGAKPSAYAINFKIYTGVVGAIHSDKGVGNWAPLGLTTVLDYLTFQFTLTGLVDPLRIQVGDLGLIDDEVVQVSTWDSTSLTIGLLRGCADTVPAKHTVGSQLYIYSRGIGADPTVYVAHESIDGRLLTATSEGILSIGLAPNKTINTIGRHPRPYPPGKLKINGSYYPSSITGSSIVLTWEHRNRVTQADKIVNFYAASVTPETGTFYTARVRSKLTLAVIEEVVTTGTTATLHADGDVIVELFSSRGSQNSWQMYSVPFEFISDNIILSATQGSIRTNLDQTILIAVAYTPTTSAASIYLNQTAAGIRAGNRQVIFYDWTGYPGGDADWSLTETVTFGATVFLQGAGSGSYGKSKFDLFVGEAGPITRVNNATEYIIDAGKPDNHGITNIFTTLGIYPNVKAASRSSPGDTSDWCQNFSTVPSAYDHAIIFPVGVVAKINPNPLASSVAANGEWEVYASTTPGSVSRPLMHETVTCNLSAGTGFLKALTSPIPQISSILFGTVAPVGSIFTVTINGVTYSYTTVSGNTIVDVTNGIMAAITDANMTMATVGLAGSIWFTVTGLPNVPFTISGTKTI